MPWTEPVYCIACEWVGRRRGSGVILKKRCPKCGGRVSMCGHASLGLTTPRGIHANERLCANRNPREAVFAQQWGHEHRHSDLLEILMDPHPNINSFLHPAISARDREVAATVIQWLGSNCGRCFLGICRDRIVEEGEKLL